MAYTRPAGNYLRILRNGEYVHIPDPDYKSGQITIATNVDEGRNSKGDFVGNVVGDDKLKYEPTWGRLTADEYMLILSFFDRSVGGSFVKTCQVLDPRTNSFVIKKFYCSDRTATPVAVTYPDGAVFYDDVKISLVEK